MPQNQGLCPPIFMNNTELPVGNTIKYLGMHLDQKLNWKEHIVKKWKQVKLKVKELYWLIGREYPLRVCSVEILLMMDLYETCRVFYQINLKNCASRLTFIIRMHGPLNVKFSSL